MTSVPADVRTVKTPRIPPPDEDEEDRLNWKDLHWNRTEQWLDQCRQIDALQEECDRRFPRLVRATQRRID